MFCFLNSSCEGNELFFQSRELFFQSINGRTPANTQLALYIRKLFFQPLCLLFNFGFYAKDNLIPLVCVKEASKDFFLLLRIGNKQSFEFTLGEHNDLAELIIREAEDFLGFFVYNGRLWVLKYGYKLVILEYLTPIFLYQILRAIPQLTMESVSVSIAFKNVFYNGLIRLFCRFTAHHFDSLPETTAGFAKQSIADRV